MMKFIKTVRDMKTKRKLKLFVIALVLFAVGRGGVANPVVARNSEIKGNPAKSSGEAVDSESNAPGAKVISLEVKAQNPKRKTKVIEVKAGTKEKPMSCGVINEAIAKLPPQGGAIKLTAGYFECHEPVVIDKDNVLFEGAGTESTILKAQPQKPFPMIVVGVMAADQEQHPRIGLQWYPKGKGPKRDQPTKNVIVQHLQVDGDRSQQPSPLEFECYDWSKKTATTCANDGGKFVRNNGITIRRSSHVTIRDVVARNCLSGGLTIEKRSDHIQVDGFYSYNNYFDGLAGYETHSSELKNVIVAENVYSGISIDFDWGPIAKGQGPNIFKNVIARDNGDNGVFSANVGGSQYENIITIGNKNIGIYVDGRRALKAEKEEALKKGEKVDFNDPSNWQMVPGTCDHQSIKNSLLVATGPAGFFVNHICQDIVFQKVKILHLPKSDCVRDPHHAGWNRDDANGVNCQKLTDDLNVKLLEQVRAIKRVDDSIFTELQKKLLGVIDSLPTKK